MMRYASIPALLIALAAASATAQTAPLDATGLQLTRAELELRLSQYDETATSEAYSPALRAQAREEAAIIRQRLQDGDLRVGDQIALTVEGHASLAGTFPVTAGRVIVLPEIGDVPLTGVLRAELQDYLTSHLSRFLVRPVVHARSLVRIEILGAVGNPGFYMVPSDMLLSDVLTQAGGPAATAEVSRISIERGKEVLYKGERVRELMVSGTTIDQISVRAGDTVRVPVRQGRMPGLRSVTATVGTAASFLWLLKRAGVL